MNTTDKGTLAEAQVLAAFVGAGLTVLQPFGPCRYDLALDDGVRLWRVQVKTGWLSSDGATATFNTESQHTRGTVRLPYAPTEVDLFAVWVPGEDLFVVPVEGVSKGKQSLRLAPSANGQAQGIRWAADYRWRGELPKVA